MITVSIVRAGSVLASVAVEYYIEPNGDAKFYGGTSVIYFSPGEANRQVTIIAKDDGVPQVIRFSVLSINQSIWDCLSSRATSKLIVCIRNAGSDDNVRI